MKIIFYAIALTATLISLSGCAVIYSHTTMPLDLNHDATKCEMDMEDGEDNIKHFRYDIVDVRWDSNAIGEVARDHGINTVYYADMEELSLLFGIWNQHTVHVYGW